MKNSLCLPTPAPSHLNGQWHDAGFVAHHSCGTVAAFHRLPRAATQIAKLLLSEIHLEERKDKPHVLKSDLCDSPRINVTL